MGRKDCVVESLVLCVGCVWPVPRHFAKSLWEEEERNPEEGSKGAAEAVIREDWMLHPVGNRDADSTLSRTAVPDSRL